MHYGENIYNRNMKTGLLIETLKLNHLNKGECLKTIGMDEMWRL